MPEHQLFRTILCPIDFSDHSRQALAYAALLASRSKGRLVVIFVEDPMLAAAASVAYDEKTLIDKARKELRRLVERTIAPYGLPMSSVTLDVAVGQPHEEIAWTAERLGCDVIVMGAHGRTGANKMMLGSTTHRILRRSPLPVLATPPVSGRAHAARPKDGPASWSSRQSISAPAIARTQLLPPPSRASSAPNWSWFTLLNRSAARRGSRSMPSGATVSVSVAPSARLTQLQDELAGVATAVRVESGKPADEIAKIASSKQVGLVVMTRRRGQGLFGPRQGSISYEVLCKANTPVLALPSDKAWMRRVVRMRA